MPRRKRNPSPSAEAHRVAASAAIRRRKREPFDPTKGEQNPWVGLLAALAVLGVLATLALSRSISAGTYRMLAIYVAIGAAVAMFAVEFALRRKQYAVTAQGWPLMRLALIRYAGGLIVLGIWNGAYFLFNEYGNGWYTAYWPIFRQLTLMYIGGGLPYAWLTMRFVPSRAKDMRDPSVLALIVFRILGQRRSVPQRLWRTIWSPSGRVTIMGMMVKAFFLPIMSVFLVSTADGFAGAIRAIVNTPGNGWDLFAQTQRVVFQAIFAADVTLAWVGYSLTSRWIDNGIRSVERTWSGWMVCIACYRPFYDMVGWYFVWPNLRAEDAPASVFTAVALTMATLLLLIYVWATTAFGLRFSNLTHRGIITQGPYKYVRHPAYISKNLGWWFEYLPTFTSASLVSLKATWFMLGWNFIYYLRARTEERHLSLDPNYRAYMKHVRWRFIPGVW